MATYTLGGDVKVYGDYIYNASAMPNNTNASSDAFLFGTNNHRLELVISLDASTAITDTKVLTFELMHCDTVDGSYTSHKVLYTVTGSSTTLSAGELLRYVPETGVKQFCKIKITTTDDLSAKKVTAWLKQIV